MVAEEKRILRKNVLAIRDSLTAEEATELSKEIEKKLFEEEHFKNARTVAFYIPKGNEVDTRKMIERAMNDGKEILVPVTNDEITMCKLTSLSELVPGRFGVLEPKRREPEDRQPDVVIVPGVVFGLCMHRIGYGKGYYDKYLKKTKAYRIGICYDFQVVEKLPNHPHDEPMDIIITDKRVVVPRAESGSD